MKQCHIINKKHLQNKDNIVKCFLFRLMYDYHILISFLALLVYISTHPKYIFKHPAIIFFMYQPKDHIQQLAEYIKRNLAKGYTMDALRFSLIKQGYSRISVEKAIELANNQLAASAPEMKEKPKITYTLLDENNNPIKSFQVEPEKKGFWSWLKELFG